jgi:hypothetical protein
MINDKSRGVFILNLLSVRLCPRTTVSLAVTNWLQTEHAVRMLGMFQTDPEDEENALCGIRT